MAQQIKSLLPEARTSKPKLETEKMGILLLHPPSQGAMLTTHGGGVDDDGGGCDEGNNDCDDDND